jgi:hypothetical protein
MAGQPPKQRRSSRKQGMHRSHLVRELAKRVNARSPVKVQLSKPARTAVKASGSKAAKSSK